jgi:hypothetical protein
MTLTLDATTEKRIQREIELGHYAEPAEVVAHALALLAGEEQGGEPVPGPENETARVAMDEAFGLWANRKEDGLAYQQRMRDEW